MVIACSLGDTRHVASRAISLMLKEEHEDVSEVGVALLSMLQSRPKASLDPVGLDISQMRRHTTDVRRQMTVGGRGHERPSCLGVIRCCSQGHTIGPNVVVENRLGASENLSQLPAVFQWRY